MKKRKGDNHIQKGDNHIQKGDNHIQKGDIHIQNGDNHIQKASQVIKNEYTQVPKTENKKQEIPHFGFLFILKNKKTSCKQHPDA